MAFKCLFWLLFANFLLQGRVLINAKLPAIIVFGDSSVDSGNNNAISTVLKCNFAPYGRDFNGSKPTGRFSNGRIATDFISEAFGIKPIIPAYLDPHYNITEFATGVSFASAGTGYDHATSDVMVSEYILLDMGKARTDSYMLNFSLIWILDSILSTETANFKKPLRRYSFTSDSFLIFLALQSVIPLWKELTYYEEYQRDLINYLGKVKANNVIAEALYLISIGTNDFLENYFMFSRRSSEYTVVEYQNFLLGVAKSFVTELYKLGARKISLTGLPPMGCLPLERATNILSGSVCVEEYNNVAKDFNEKLKGLVEQLNKELPGIHLILSDTYGILSDIIEKPYSFGFENAEMACCGTGMFEMGYMCNKINPFTCSDADKYVFWDAFHPTERTNSFVADYVVKHSLTEFL
ncbi:hypothetical protein ACFE04_006388 [Oxalis oulophora]